MRLTIIGTGRVGLATGVCLAHLGHEIIGLDIDPEKVARLSDGKAPFFEPRLQELLEEGLAHSRLAFTTDASQALRDAEAVFICVDTPPNGNGGARLTSVENAAVDVGRHARRDVVVVEKSTVPAGTADRIRHVLMHENRPLGDCEIVSNPEFLREGSAVEDTLRPDRLLVGAGSERGFEMMRRIYRPLLDADVGLIETDIKTAELAKHACNAFLALKISYANAVARVCERAGADVEAVTRVMGSDQRIGPHFLQAGLGYGGFCFPKDVDAFHSLSADLGYDFPLLKEVARINVEAVETAVDKIREAVWNIDNKRVALLGLAFKPDTDDVRCSPAIALAERLFEEGAEVVGYDPEAMREAKEALPQLVPATDPYDAACDAHCLVVATDWEEFKTLDLARFRDVLRYPIIVDGRNMFDPADVRKMGFSYYPVGRQPVIRKPEVAYE